MKVEFFHDVLCSYCYVASPNLRKIAELFPELEFIHRGFMLISDVKDYQMEFGSMEEARKQLAKHWNHANTLDHHKRFNTKGLEESGTELPISIHGLKACEAARAIGGESCYWDMFDQLQKALFTDVRNIGDIDVLESVAVAAGLDILKFREYLFSKSVEEKVQEDLNIVKAYGVDVVPLLIFDGKTDETHSIVATKSYDELEAFVSNLVRR